MAMKVIDLFKISVKALRVNYLRTFLTMLGLIIGISSVIVLMSVGAGVKTFVNQQFEMIGSNNIFIIPGKVAMGSGQLKRGEGSMPNVLSSKLKSKYIKGISRLSSDILGVTGSIEMPSSANYKTESVFTTLVGINEDFVKVANLGVSIGRPIVKEDVANRKKVAVIGPEIAEEILAGIDPLGKKITVADTKFTVVGLTEERGGMGGAMSMDNTVYVPLPIVQSLTDRDNLQTIMVKVTDREQIPGVMNLVENYLLEELDEDDFSVIDQSKILATVNSILSVLTYALTVIASISLLVGGVGVMNIMFVSVVERTREIGIRKAVGAKPADIRWQFLTEAVILSIIGGILGVLLGVVGAAVARRWLMTTVTPGSVILSLGVCSAVGIIFGVVPAVRAAKLDSVEALRYE